jgi:hypothetical protein
MRMVAIALLLAALPGTTLAAELAAPVVSSRGYVSLADVLGGAGSGAPALEASLKTLAIQMQASDPILAEAEATFPGICDRLAGEMRPIFLRHQREVARQYRPRMIAVLREAMAEDEAAALAAFYRSPLGARISRSVATTHNAAQREGDTPAEVLTAVLTPDEIAYVDRFFGKGPGRKLTPLLPRLTAMRAEMERAPLSAEHRQEIKAIVTRAVTLFRVVPDAPSVLPPAPTLKFGRIERT